ncbi:DNA/RNA polymerases superfamily protein [Gossypium australe]|uniref:DNA/RNA polymerases superfamily protein n=1 Tax=Gossypium australe TaxID=47621 RepID=A0A5B6VVS2_9ROSI|nr:DNA/RNA polymerases superfamily protein [Gossypium australe]
MIPEWKWDRVTMDFVSGFKDAIWVVVDRLTKSTYFIPIHMDYSLDKLVELYIYEIVRLHGVPVLIISDKDPSTIFHPQTDGQSERVIQILKDMFRCCVLEFEGNWEKYLPLIKFTLYGRKCKTPLYWTELSEKKIHGVYLIRETEEKVKIIRGSLKAALDRQKLYADLKRKDIEFRSKKLCFGREGKLSPRFIRPYEIIERIGPVAYRLALPSELEKIHNLRNKSIALVKVLWKSHRVEEATWKLEEAMRK